MHIRFSQALLKVRRSRAYSDVQRSFSWREIIFPSRKRTAISRRPAWTQEEPWRRAPIWSPCWSMKINVYPRRVRRAKLDLQVGNHPALYLVIAKKIVTVQSYSFLFSYSWKQEAWWFHHMLIWMKKCLCKQACNTLSHSNQRMAEL